MVWLYNRVMESSVRKCGGNEISWSSHEELMAPAWDRSCDWNHPHDVFCCHALQMADAIADLALQPNRNRLTSGENRSASSSS